MSMSKKDFIALADQLKIGLSPAELTPNIITVLCQFMRGQNSAFMDQRWRDYLAGKCGPGGGAIKKSGAQRWPGGGPVLARDR